MLLLVPTARDGFSAASVVGLKAFSRTPLLTTTMLSIRGGGATLKDYSSAASSYFDSVRTPAALIAGSTFAAVFVLADRTKSGESTKHSRIENNCLAPPLHDFLSGRAVVEFECGGDGNGRREHASIGHARKIYVGRVILSFANKRI